ncbi:hypothetical protein Pelo_13554 [Pelomyxa schiedti]|nr:hypothetical protein Pelo_13554 [Pelomyxa schiedti]
MQQSHVQRYVSYFSCYATVISSVALTPYSVYYMYGILASRQQYILTKNLYTQLNIVNGERCTLRSIHYTTKVAQRHTPALMTAIQHLQQQMKLQNYVLLPAMPDFITIPIDHSIVLINHKAQGQTLGSTVVDLAIPPTGPAPSTMDAIVALSRCKNWNSLYLLRSIPDKVLTQALPAELRTELARQNTLAENTATPVHAKHVFNVTAMTSHAIPDCRAILRAADNPTFTTLPPCGT